MTWPEYRIGRKKEQWNWGVAVQLIEAKAQQGSAWIEGPKGTAREGSKQKEIRRTFKMLREI